MVTQLPATGGKKSATPSTWASDLLRHRSVQLVIAAWAASVAFVFMVDHGTLPFDRPTLAGISAAGQVLSQQVQLLEALGIIAIALFVTRRRPAPAVAGRAPAPAVSRIEVLGIAGYAIAVQAIGYAAGHLLGTFPISLHLPGTIFGIRKTISPDQIALWAGYNFVAYAVIPYVVFRARGYSNEALNLKSANRAKDALLIAVVLIVESAVELAYNPHIFSLSGHQLLLGAPAAFVIYFVGTSLPIMVFIYAILLPRYLKLTGSIVTTVILGGLTYAALHVFESWGLYDTPTHAVLSLIFVAFQYFGPGMVKSVLTLRTGNAWVHVWAYHAIAPHVWLDTPLIVQALAVR